VVKKMAMWKMVEEACVPDRSGSLVLDYLMLGKFMHEAERKFDNFKVIFITTTWYIWWIRCHKLHGEPVLKYLKLKCRSKF
jgi:hypothetical protein